MLASGPARYAFQSYISMPILFPDGRFFGTLCAIDPWPARLDTPEIVGMFKLFAELIAFHFDASERLASSEANLSNERKTAELREQFIAVLGHDLRNPLASINAGAKGLLRTPLDAKAAGIVRLIQGSVSRMSGLIDNVLDLARGRLGGGLGVERNASEPLEPILVQVVEEMRTGWPERVIEAEIALAGPLDCDRSRLGQLLSNLLSNAVAYGQHDAPVCVQAGLDGDDFELSVSNAGDPISPAVMERLFHPFSRGSVRPNQQGLGLGLYIASEIARAHGGTLDVVSNHEETRFTFRMPARLS